MCSISKAALEAIVYYRPCGLTCVQGNSEVNAAPATAVQSQGKTPNTCAMATWDKCTQNAAQDLGLSSMPSDPAEFSQDMEELMKKKGVKGLTQLCKAYSNWEGCLGSEAGECKSFQYLKSIGMEDEQAYTWIATWGAIQEECGPQRKTMMDNFECIGSVYENFTHPIQHCIDDFKRFIEHDPEHICHYAEEFILCIKKPFKDHCSMGVGNAMCAVQKAGLEAISFYKTCHLTCDQSSDISVPHKLILRHHNTVTHDNPPIKQQEKKCSRQKLITALEPVKVLLDPQDEGQGNPRTYKDLFNEFIREGTLHDQINTLCNTYNAFRTNLSQAAEDCISFHFLENAINLEKSDATIFNSQYRQVEALCGDDYEVTVANLGCILETFDSEEMKETQSSCLKHYFRNLAHQPNEAQSAWISLITCWSLPLEQRCGHDAAELICKTMTAALKPSKDWPQYIDCTGA
jgi:hypothetical protein